MSRSWAGGSTTRWRNLREAILLANANTNRGRCALNVGAHCPKHGRPCPGVCTGTAQAVHHTKGKEYGDDPRDLVACCSACNSHVGRPSAISPEPTPRSRW
jgi:hypothetical protein